MAAAAEAEVEATLYRRTLTVTTQRPDQRDNYAACSVYFVVTADGTIAEPGRAGTIGYVGTRAPVLEGPAVQPPTTCQFPPMVSRETCTELATAAFAALQGPSAVDRVEFTSRAHGIIVSVCRNTVQFDFAKTPPTIESREFD